jgi:hypothetical protein
MSAAQPAAAQLNTIQVQDSMRSAPVGHGVVVAQRGQHEVDCVLGAAGGVAGGVRGYVGHPDSKLGGLKQAMETPPS